MLLYDEKIEQDIKKYSNKRKKYHKNRGTKIINQDGRMIEYRTDLNEEEVISDIKKMTNRQLCEKYDINYTTFISRIYSMGMNHFEAILSKNIISTKKVKFRIPIDNKKLTVSQYCKDLDELTITTYKRIERGWTLQMLENYYKNKLGL